MKLRILRLLNGFRTEKDTKGLIGTSHGGYPLSVSLGGCSCNVVPWKVWPWHCPRAKYCEGIGWDYSHSQYCNLQGGQI